MSEALNLERAEIAKRHAIAMSNASRVHGNQNPEDADPVAATMGAAIQLGVMTSQLIDMGMVSPTSAGKFMSTLLDLAEGVAENMVGFKP